MKKNRIKLGVNIDHIATLRQARMEGIPDLIQAAKAAIKGGADSIVAHLREDRRHIQDADVYAIRKLGTRFDMEMAATDEMLEIALKIRPDMVTLVPEKRKELTTEGGLDVVRNNLQVMKVARTLEKNNIRASLFIDPEMIQVEAASKTGACCVEIHTGKYAFKASGREHELKKIKMSVIMAKRLNLQVNAGHGLNYDNVRDIAGIKGVEELNIGFSIISRAVLVGMERAVSEMKKAVSGAV